CLAFAMSDAHAAARGPWTELSCEYLFFHAKRRDQQPPHTGASMGATRKAVELDGQPLETGWPYLNALPTDLRKWKPPHRVGPLFQRTSIMVGSDFGDAWDAVANGTPALIGMTISNAFFTPNQAGVVDSTEVVDPHRRHAVVAAAAGKRAGKR